MHHVGFSYESQPARRTDLIGHSRQRQRYFNTPAKPLSKYQSFITPPQYIELRGIVISPSVCLSDCLSASISLEPLDRAARNFLRGFPVAVARSSSGGAALRYVLPVLRMTSRLAAVGRMRARAISLLAKHIVHITSWRFETGAESDVYELCLVITRTASWLDCTV